MILLAERAIRLQTEYPEGRIGPSYFHERTSREKREEVAGTPKPLIRN